TVGLGVSWDWGRWWTYDGISGPNYWGLINPDWSLCSHGRRQSPVNLDPTLLLYDPNLRPLHIDNHTVVGIVNNTGHSVVFTVKESKEPENKVGVVNAVMIGPTGRRPILEQQEERIHPHIKPVNISGGPLSYRYKVHQVQLHFGSQDHMGSEHSVNGTQFPAEVQIYGYNSQLFNNFSEAQEKPHGVVALCVMIQVSNQATPALTVLTSAMEKIRYAGSWSFLGPLSIAGLLPSTANYITYEGSLTQPPCHETVDWILINKPIYITKHQLYSLRKLHQGNALRPKARMVNNFRPTQQLHHRTLRTNIDFTNGQYFNCPSLAHQVVYTANSWR
ncbi:unnamed protein product, partial [Meganyctiphanes norvegica]